MAFKGQWALRDKFYTDPPERLHTSDPAHAEWDDDELNQQTYTAPYGPGVGDLYDDYVGLDLWIAETPGRVFDTTPDDHRDGYPSEAYPTDLEYVAASSAAHGDDRGSSRELNFEQPPFQASDETYWGNRFEGLDSTPINPVALVRGLNSQPENNPDGFRRGWDSYSGVDRKMYDPERIHDERVNLVNTAHGPTDQPVPENATPYNSPFDSLARIMDRSPRPMMRREPPPFDESITTDGDDLDPVEIQTWVVG